MQKMSPKRYFLKAQKFTAVMKMSMKPVIAFSKDKKGKTRAGKLHDYNIIIRVANQNSSSPLIY